MNVFDIAFPPHVPDPAVSALPSANLGFYDLAFDADLRRGTWLDEWPVMQFVEHHYGIATTAGCASNRTNLAFLELAAKAEEKPGGRFLVQRFTPLWDASERSVRLAITGLRKATLLAEEHDRLLAEGSDGR